MNYKNALKSGKKIGVSKASDKAFLAQTCEVLSTVHAVNPEMLFNGAKKLGMDAKAVAKVANENLGEFAFIQFA